MGLRLRQDLQTEDADIQAKIADLIKRKRAYEEKMKKLKDKKLSRSQNKRRRIEEREKAKSACSEVVFKPSNNEEKKKKGPWFCFICKQRIKKRTKQIRHLWSIHVHHPGDLIFY